MQAHYSVQAAAKFIAYSSVQALAKFILHDSGTCVTDHQGPITKKDTHLKQGLNARDYVFCRREEVQDIDKELIESADLQDFVDCFLLF